jgi:prepilin-type N-terminal cleavage/methylation domain-containing protein
MKSSKGFTLIELLVVIAIIALLLSIMLPSLNAVKEAGRLVVCSSNQHSLLLGYIMYADSNDSKLCGSYNYRTDYPDWGGQESWAWAPYDQQNSTTVPVNTLPTLEQRHKGIELGSLFEYNPDLDLYHCPSDKAQLDERKFRSYSIPDCLNGMWTNWTVYKKYSQIRNPAAKYVFVEEDDDRYYNMNSWILSPDSSYADGIDRSKWNDPYLTIWHNDISSRGYIDGHVEKYKWASETRKFLSQQSKEAFQAEGNPWGGAYGSVYNCTPQTDGGKEDLANMVEGWAK